MKRVIIDLILASCTLGFIASLYSWEWEVRNVHGWWLWYFEIVLRSLFFFTLFLASYSLYLWRKRN